MVRAYQKSKFRARAVILLNGWIMRQIVCVLALATAVALWPSADAGSTPKVEPSSGEHASYTGNCTSCYGFAKLIASRGVL